MSVAKVPGGSIANRPQKSSSLQHRLGTLRSKPRSLLHPLPPPSRTPLQSRLQSCPRKQNSTTCSRSSQMPPTPTSRKPTARSERMNGAWTRSVVADGRALQGTAVTSGQGRRPRALQGGHSCVRIAVFGSRCLIAQACGFCSYEVLSDSQKRGLCVGGIVHR